MHSYRFAKFSASNANIQNRVRAAFDNTDGFHGGVDENRLGAVSPMAARSCWRVCLVYVMRFLLWVFSDRGNPLVTNTYGTMRVNGYKLLEDALNLRDTKIYDTIHDADGDHLVHLT